ncbi:MAG: antitoxin [Lysobacteraceae bacterium]|nr:MAG: antitoxin [Xanthomonadaceae bacterium]
MATMNISLPEPMRSWIQDRIAGGRYASSSDYVRDLIRKDQERHDKIRVLQQAITKGFQSGNAETFDVEAFKREMLESLDDA